MSSSTTNWINFDPTDPIQGVIKFFTFVGIWPTKNKYRCLHIMYIIYGILFQFTFSYAYVGFELGNAMFVTSMEMMTEEIFVGLAEISMCIRMTNFIVNFSEAYSFLKRIKSFKLYNQEECDLYKDKLSIFSTVMKFYMGCGTFAITFSAIAPQFTEELKLPYPSAYPWDWRSNVVCYWILYAYQVSGIIFLTFTLVGLENYQIFCMISVGAQIDILGMRIRQIGYNRIAKTTNLTKILTLKEREDKDMYNLLTLLECIKEHKSLISFVSDIERVFNIPFLFQLFCSSVIFCLTGFQIIMMDDPSSKTMVLAYYICFYATMLNEIFLPCYFGTQITSINEDLLTSAYSSNWPELSQSFKKTTILFMEYLQRPKIMMSGKIFTLTLFSFLTVINRSYSLFCVIRNIIK